MSNRQNQPWSLRNKAIWRFFFLYIVLYIYPYGFEYIHELTTSDISFWPSITIWFADTFLGWEINKDYLLNGFDSKYDYSRFLLVACLSIIGTIIWLLVDRLIQRNYDLKLKILLQTILRYHVGLTLIIYGLSKVFLLQFGEMGIESLETEVGNHSGMGFLWTFMSHSKFYVFVAGLIEVIGGVLLLFRRTSFLGAFILFIAMANVVLMDIGYDVRVKMFAIHLFLMTVLLMSDDLKRLYQFFISNTSTKPVKFSPLFNGKKAKKVGYVLKGILLLYYTVSCVNSYTERFQEEKSVLYPEFSHAHTIEIFVKNGDTISDAASNGNRWKQLIMNGVSYLPDTFVLTQVDGSRKRYQFEADTIAKTMKYQTFRDTTENYQQLKYTKLEENVFVFEGILEGDTLWMKTKTKSIEDYPLSNKMRWITDLK